MAVKVSTATGTVARLSYRQLGFLSIVPPAFYS